LERGKSKHEISPGESRGRKNGEGESPLSPPPDTDETEDSVPVVSTELGDPPWRRR